MTPPAMQAPLPGSVSIDATQADPFLDNARAGTPTAGAHSSIQTAVANLLARAKTSPGGIASLVGHGAPGIIAVGAGQSPGTPQQHISTTNEEVWVPLLQPLRGQVSALNLYGAQIGAGALGAHLLYDIARVINAVVSAPAGLIYCTPQGDFLFPQGVVWQTATPEQLPQPINPPTLGRAPSPISARISATAAFNAQGAPLSSRSAQALAAAVLWDQPIEPPGAVGGLVSGRLRVGFMRGALKTFTIYNNSLIRDDSTPQVHYPVTPQFAAIALGR